MSVTNKPWPRRHRLTVQDYHRMGEVGLLRPDERVEGVSPSCDAWP
jgi:hypothetical protein